MTDTPLTPAAGGIPHYAKDDFVSGQDVRWCPGCGDYSILSVMQRMLAENTTTIRENHVFISGIGCSSRFPYYMNTYGFHTIHGRAPAIATGLKCARPDLTVWVITGDGDGLSIGGNHLIHALRRNIDIKIILVNNEIYGLTKGQYSPTSKQGKVAKSTPDGSIDYPINPLCIAIAAEATFIARTYDTDPRHMGQVLAEAMRHKGSAFVEILQNCVIFNKDTHQPIVGRENREDRAFYLENGKPLIFGKNKDRGLKTHGLRIEVVDLSAHPEEAPNLLVHNPAFDDPHYAYLLTQLEYPDKPVPFGVFRDIQKPTYDGMLGDQISAAIQKRGAGSLEKLLFTDEIWHVEAQKIVEASPAAEEKARPDTAASEQDYWQAEEVRHLIHGEESKAPKGKIEKTLTNVRVEDFISKVPAILVAPDTTLQEIVDRFQNNPKKGCVLVRDNSGGLAGIITIRDILWRVAGIHTDLTVCRAQDVMTRRPECVEKGTTLAYAVHKMAVNRIRHVPILENGKPIGVVSTRDIITYLSGQ